MKSPTMCWYDVSQATTRRADELTTQLAQEQALATQLRQQRDELAATVATTQEQLSTAREQAVAAEGKREVAEERARMAERALQDWRALEEDRRRIMQQREEQLQQLSQVCGVCYSCRRAMGMHTDGGSHECLVLAYLCRGSQPRFMGSFTFQFQARNHLANAWAHVAGMCRSTCA